MDKLYPGIILSDDLIKIAASDLLQSNKNKLQNGVSCFYNDIYKTNRYEHMLGTALLTCKAGGSIDEQKAALVHDIMHANFSHVIDYLDLDFDFDRGQNRNQNVSMSYHENHKQEFLDEHSHELAQLLGSNWQMYFENKNWPSVKDNKHLAADIVDYSIRDAVNYKLITIVEAHQILDTIKIQNGVMSSTAKNRIINLLKELSEKVYNTFDDYNQNYNFAIVLKKYVSMSDIIRGKLVDEEIWNKYKQYIVNTNHNTKQTRLRLIT